MTAGAQQMVNRLTATNSPYRGLLSSDYGERSKMYTPNIKPVSAAPGPWAYELEARSAEISNLIKGVPTPAKPVLTCPGEYNCVALSLKGVELYRYGKAAEGKACLELAVRQAEGVPGNLQYVAHQYKEIGDHAEAIRLYQRALAMNDPSTNPDLAVHVHLSIAQIQFELGRLSEALASGEQAMVFAKTAKNPYVATNVAELKRKIEAKLAAKP